MKQNLILINLILIIINLSKIVDSIDSELGVPVLLWSKPNNDLINNNIYESINSHSSVNQIDYNVLRDDYLSKSQTIVVFLQKNICIEQFSTEDEKKFKTIKSIINDRSLEPLFLTDVLKPIEAIKDFRTQDINQLNINNGNKIVIELSNNRLVENDGLIGELVSKMAQNVTERALYLITGRQNCYSDVEVEESEDSHRFGRHVLAEDEDDSDGSLSNQTKRLISVKNCLFLYMTELTVSHYNNTILDTIESYDTIINKPNISQTSRCWEIEEKNSTQSETAVINFSFNNNSKIEIQFTIDSQHYRNRTDFWRIKEGFAILDENKTGNTIEYELFVSGVTSETLFSYSCSKLVILSQIRNKTKPEDGLTQISLVFKNFQLQPFPNPHNKNTTDGNKYYVFTDSFDCETWMTLPLWMGLLTVLMFFIIIFIGIYFLSQVNTPDRFENPKGKPLMISNIDE